MKIKKPRTSQASKLKSAAKIVIMRIMAVKIRDTTTDSNSSAFGFLQEAGFRNISPDGHYLNAVTPEGDMLFLLEYEPKTETNMQYAPFRIVRVHRGTPLEIDKGEIKFSYPAVNGVTELSAKGEEASDWEMTVEPSALEAIPKKGAFCATDSPVAQAVNGRAAGSLPSTAEGLIRLELERRREMVENSEIRQALVSKTSSPNSHEPLLVEEERLKRWPRNKRFWDCARQYLERHNQKEEPMISTISLALNELEKSGIDRDLLVDMFGDHPANIDRLLSVRLLHRELWPLLDKPHGDKDRISPESLSVLTQISLYDQVRIWNKAKKAGINTLIVLELKKLCGMSLTAKPSWNPKLNAAIKPT
jgi:hypothetical protein